MYIMHIAIVKVLCKSSMASPPLIFLPSFRASYPSYWSYWLLHNSASHFSTHNVIYPNRPVGGY